ncbi:MAG: hypothetical protein KF705_16390, partial [Phycisphaeraceae bacterium]|nr:hypothetical protein [Phycisphaeraceae bacterium]
MAAAEHAIDASPRVTRVRTSAGKVRNFRRETLLIIGAAIGGSAALIGFLAWCVSTSPTRPSPSWVSMNTLILLAFIAVPCVLAVRDRSRWLRRLHCQVEHTWLVHAGKDEMRICIASFGVRPYERYLTAGIGTAAMSAVWRIPKVNGELELFIGGEAKRSKRSVTDSEGTAPSVCAWIPAGVDASLIATLSGKDRHRVPGWYVSICILGDSSAPEFLEAVVERENQRAAL